MSIQPMDEAGEPILFPDAPAYSPTHPHELLAGYVQMAREGGAAASYARWRCGLLSRQTPELYAHLLSDFDAELELAGIPVPEPFAKWASRELGRQ